MSWLVHDQDALSEPTRAQDQACETLAERYDRVEVHNRPDGIAEAVCMNYEAPGGYRVKWLVEVEPDGREIRHLRKS